MADSDEEYYTQREAHYGQQRSSLRSDTSTRSRSRPQSGNPLSSDYNLPANYENLNEAAAPAPIENPAETTWYRHRSWEDDGRRWSGRSGGGSIGRFGTPPTSAQSRNSRRSSPLVRADEYTIPSQYENLNEFAVPSPVENPHEEQIYRHRSLEDERSRSRDARRASQLQGSKSRRPTQPTSDVTALPTIRDDRRYPQEEYQLGSSSEENGILKSSPGKQRASRFATELYTVSYLVLFSLLGTLARLGLQWLTFYPGAPLVTPVLWANFAGTLFMGFLAEDRRLFRDEWGTGTSTPNLFDEKQPPDQLQAARAAHAKVKKTIPLYIGLATGFCGSFTSFSSFMRDVFFALSNDLPTPLNHPYPSSANPISTSSTVHRNGGYSFMAVLAIILLTTGMCLSALKLGAHIAIFLDPLTPSLPFRLVRKIFDRTVVLTAWLAWLGAILMSIWPPDRPSGPQTHGTWSHETWRGQAIFALVFAPLGCLLRFYLSLKLNGLIPSFPLGTFCVNVFGTAVLGMAFDLQHVGFDTGVAGGGRVSCQVLQGIMDGFCGCLTTVSTWIAEVNGLRRRHAYMYGGASVVVGLGILVVVMGSVRWTVGWTAPACVT